MTRQQKYPDTSTFHYYNANPKNRITGDCLIRAISTAAEIPYNTVVMEMAELQCKTGYDSYKLIDRYLKSKGWVKHQQPRREDNTRYTGKEFCEYLHLYSDRSFVPYIEGNVIANIGSHHIVAFVEEDKHHHTYRCYDIWNSTSGCIGNYWVKE